MKGGAYIRHKDGTMERVAFTAPAAGSLAAVAQSVAPASSQRSDSPLTQHPLDHDGDGKAGGSLPATSVAQDISAVELADLGERNDIDFPTLRTAARRFLGNAVPAKKKDIITALRKAAADQEN